MKHKFTFLLIFALVTLNMFSQNERKFIKQVQSYMENKEYQKAIDLCDEFIDQDPYYDISYHYHAVANYYLDNYKESLDSFTKLLELNPESEITYANRGGTYVAIGYDKKALVDFKESFRMNPKNPVGLNNRSIVYMHVGQLDKALVDIREAIRYKEKLSSENYQNVAEIYWYKGNLDSTLHYVNKSLELNPDYLSSQYYKLKVHLKRKQQSQAYDACKKIIELCNKNIEIGYKPISSHYMRAVANDILGAYGNRIQAEKDYLEALEILNEQISLLPDAYLLLYNRGNIYEKLGKAKEAQADFRKARTINPNYPEFKIKNVFPQKRY